MTLITIVLVIMVLASLWSSLEFAKELAHATVLE